MKDVLILIAVLVNVFSAFVWDFVGWQKDRKLQKLRHDILEMEKEIVALEVLRHATMRATSRKDVEALARAHEFISTARCGFAVRRPKGEAS